ncbi:MAG: ATP-binding cassette domain-containing protein, partial [Clostridia bacterium]|nr:ATP-binding cassette domain-containing protein [Clostridia bacterium]
MLELKNVFLAYNREYYALFDINLTLNKGDHLAIIGDTGSGKTALLRAISGLEKLNKGDIYINNTNLNKINFETDISLGYISTKPVFFENKTVEKNLEWVLKQRNIDKAYWDSIITQVLEEYGISTLRKVRINTLCRSDKRLVQIARLALRPIDI